MRKATQKEFETIQEIFSLNYVKVLFKQFLEEGLLTKREYELLIKKLDQDINKVLDKGGLIWKKEKQQVFIFVYQHKIIDCEINENLNLTAEDILIRRDIDYINKIGVSIDIQTRNLDLCQVFRHIFWKDKEKDDGLSL